jgi:hypothetical protein
MKRLYLSILILSLIRLEGFGEKPQIDPIQSPVRNSAIVDCTMSLSSEFLDINNVRAQVLAGGDMWWSVFGAGNASYEIPKNDNPNVPKKHSLFAGSLWMGGIDNISGDLFVIANTYRQSHYTLWTGPFQETGPSAGIISPEDCNRWDRHFKVDKSEIVNFISDFEAGLILVPKDIPESILHWPGKNNPHIQNWEEMAGVDMDQSLAPFVERSDCQPDGNYDPMDGDYPDILGDQAIWWVMNDIGNVKEFGGIVGGTGAGPGHIQIECMAFAVVSNDCMNDATFYKYTIKNKGQKSFDSTYFGQWMDPDLGSFGDDFVEVDVPRGLSYTYNGDEFDEGVNGYGENPPAIGLDFFVGPKADLDTLGDGIDNDGDGVVDEYDPIWMPGVAVYEGDGIDNDKDCLVDEPDERISMSNFLYYNGSSNPVNSNPGSASDFFNYLRSVWRDYSYMTYDGFSGTNQNAPRCHYMFPGSSDLEIGWGLGGTCSEPFTGPENFIWDETTAGNSPSDRRMLGSVGPFSFRSGEINDLILGIPWARATSGGPKASVAKLKFCDDEIQLLFSPGALKDVSFLNGPNGPDINLNEGDKEIILQWTPSEFSVWNQGTVQQVNTETYRERSLRTGTDYLFQGYKVFQLRNGEVEPSDLDNPDKARQIAIFDLNDQVTRLINYETDYDLGLDKRIPILKVEGVDNGISRTLRIGEDAFAEGDKSLINQRSYYFLVLAYAYNAEEEVLNNSGLVLERVGKPYLESQKGLKVVTGIPHIPIGELVNSEYGDEFEITRERGMGNGGGILELRAGLEEEIFSGKKARLTYRAGRGPIKVKVADPRKLMDIDNYRVELSSSLVYKRDDSFFFLPGDTIISLAEFDFADTSNLSPGFNAGINDFVKQVPGIAVVIRELEDLKTGDFQTLEIRLLNGADGGSFTKEVFVSDGRFLAYYDEEQASFELKSGSESINALATSFKRNDFWTLEADGIIAKSSYPISREVEEIIPDLGISLQLRPGLYPGYRSADLEVNKNNGLLEASLEFTDPSRPWFTPVNFEKVIWQDDQLGENPADSLRVYQRVLSGGAGPYVFGKANSTELSESPFVKAGIPLSEYINFKNSFVGLGNVDIVFAPNDQSKWSRVGVIQFKEDAGSPPPTFFHRSAKSTLAAIGKDGNPDGSKTKSGTASLGWSWFPGYAIDLDRGIRLNLWIAESLEEDPVSGNDLLWNPDTSSNAKKHFIILTNRPYDFGPNGERGAYQDEVDELFSSPSVAVSDYGLWYVKNFTWNLYLRINPLVKIPSEDRNSARIRLRVQRAYEDVENNKSPVFSFSTKGMGTFKNDLAKGQEQLDIIRVVPNPYYAYSQYEAGGNDRIVKITNLPAKCMVSIFSLNGSLLRQFKRNGTQEEILVSESTSCNDSLSSENPEGTINEELVVLEGDIPGRGLTSIDWDLKNESGNAVGSGVFIIHVDAGELGEKVVKFFNITRSIDLNTF